VECALADVIERAAQRMNRLIQDLLDITRMEAGHLVIERARISATQLVLDSVEAERALATAGSLELALDIGSDLPELWADRDRLLQVVENLIGNALKFTKPGGRVRVAAAAHDDEVLFSVADTGAGIADLDMPHVFDRFWQGRKTGRRGAGLGLPIAKGIVEAHGGRIWVDSQLGCGSTFYFTIPAAAR
jgi:signal transduction histidine kinase